MDLINILFVVGYILASAICLALMFMSASDDALGVSAICLLGAIVWGLRAYGHWRYGQ